MASDRLSLIIFLGVTALIPEMVRAGRNLTVLRDSSYPPEYLVNLVKNSLDKCHSETDIEESVISRFRDDEDDEGTPKLGCYLFCIFNSSEFWMNDRDELDIMKILDIIPKSFETHALKMGLRCLKVKGNDKCERSLWYHNCWKKTDPEHYFLM
ncbi:general odorant-binding protein 83a-like [Uranotaenia lowii]|uniref:general odorant-binding protein 83a-like n=1 Tax=Uranotaenia lowii TaxID=190385 RepID=UPI002479A886|nr:general odorant-binding protein 83a-like [Uranotaenia lowii]